MPQSFDASPAALGFIHQLRWALLELLRSARLDESVRVTLETHDDVALTDDGGRPLKAVQLKQHQGPSQLTDMSADLWKTLRVWLETPQLSSPGGPLLYLMTTATVPPSSAASLLGLEARDVERADSLLMKAAIDSEAKGTAVARQTWGQTSKARRLVILRRSVILPDSPAIADLDTILRQELRTTVRDKHAALFLERLWGWWDQACVQVLLGNTRGEFLSVSGSQLLQKVQEIRDEFTEDALPIDWSLADIGEEQIEEHYSKLFVDQLKWVSVHGANLRRAVVDYHRAYAQTARWLQDGDLVEEDLSRYETDLQIEWQLHFEDMCDALAAENRLDAASRAKAGRQLFQLLRETTDAVIRAGFSEQFLYRGSRHILADRGAIGWHPDFVERLAALTVGAQP